MSKPSMIVCPKAKQTAALNFSRKFLAFYLVMKADEFKNGTKAQNSEILRCKLWENQGIKFKQNMLKFAPKDKKNDFHRPNPHRADLQEIRHHA